MTASLIQAFKSLRSYDEPKKGKSSKKSKPKLSRKRKAAGSEEPSGSRKRACPNASDFASSSAAQHAPAPPSQPSAAA
ncbi:hypothetical protein CU097_004242, partial [Rhizopus azygosporus]